MPGRPALTRSPLEDSRLRLFGPSPWKILAATEQPSPWRRSSKRESCYGDRVYCCYRYWFALLLLLLLLLIVNIITCTNIIIIIIIIMTGSWDQRFGAGRVSIDNNNNNKIDNNNNDHTNTHNMYNDKQQCSTHDNNT